MKVLGRQLLELTRHAVGEFAKPDAHNSIVRPPSAGIDFSKYAYLNLFTSLENSLPDNAQCLHLFSVLGIRGIFHTRTLHD